MLSGIGDADELGRHGIETVHHLPGVGKNLQDHVDVCVVYEAVKPVTLYSDLRIDRLTFAILQGFLFGEGVATTFPYEGGAFMRSRPGLEAPDIQAHFMPALEKTANLHWPKPFKRARVEDNHGMTIRVGPVNPESRGTISLRSADPRDPPKIHANYLKTEFDKQTTIAGVKMMREVMAPARLRRHSRPGDRAGTGRSVGRRAEGLAEAGRRNDAPPGRHLQDGDRRDGGRRCRAQGPRHRRAARRRRLDHADHFERQHQRPNHHDRREGRRHGAEGGGLTEDRLFVEHRTYTFRPGTMARWLKKYEADGLPLQKKHLGRPLGFFTTEIGNLHQVVLLWIFDSLDDRDRRRTAMSADPEWQKYMEEIWAMNAIEAQESKILRPTSFSPAPA